MTNDLISRQAIMKEFADFVRESNNSDFAQTPTWNDAVSLVGSMPSAQLDLSGYSDRLWKSAYASGYERCRQDAIDVAKQHWYKPDIAKALEELPSAQPEQQWIPCSERLPENRRYVLVTYQYEYGLIDHGITWYGEAEKKWNTSREVIAWMPLPEPYKGDTNG